MVEKEQILSRTKNLPSVVSPTNYEDYQIWEGNEGEAHFKITKEILPGFKNPLYSLSVSGEPVGTAKVIGDFVEALGDPLAIREQLPGIIFVLWDSKSADQRRAISP